MAVALCWRHPDRREVEIALYVMLRMAHVQGYARIVVLCGRRGDATLAVELAPEASEEDAHTWASLLDKRYRVETTVDELLGRAADFTEIYNAGGVGAFLAGYTREQERMEELRRRARSERR